MDIELLSPPRGKKREIWHSFLRRVRLEAEEPVDQTVLVWDGEVLAATGSRQGNLLKCIAVDPLYQGDGLLATVLTALRQAAFQKGFRHLFLCTRPANAALFSALYFYPVAQTDQVLLMENRENGILDFLNTLRRKEPPVPAGAAVMNCSPFTLGHQYLIETAARECEHLYVFILSQENGPFSAKDRLRMAELGTAHLPNVSILPTGPYLISQATFPTYFLHDREKAGEVHCLLDIAVFTRYFVPRFHIVRRYVGTEPLSPMTAQYNAALGANLPRHGIALRELPRLEHSGVPVSASAVRAALAAGDLDTVQSLVPQTTFSYLLTLPKEEPR